MRLRERVGRYEDETLAEYQQRFREHFALIVEGSCPNCPDSRLVVHEHDGETWACCNGGCGWSWRAITCTDDERYSFANRGDPLIQQASHVFWH